MATVAEILEDVNKKLKKDAKFTGTLSYADPKLVLNFVDGVLHGPKAIERDVTVIETDMTKEVLFWEELNINHGKVHGVFLTYYGKNHDTQETVTAHDEVDFDLTNFLTHRLKKLIGQTFITMKDFEGNVSVLVSPYKKTPEQVVVNWFNFNDIEIDMEVETRYAGLYDEMQYIRMETVGQ